MHFIRIYSVFFFFLVLSCKSQETKINGVSFVASSQKISSENTEPVVNIGANYVSLMPFGFMRKLQATELKYNASRQWFGETMEGIKQYIHEFRKKKIKIMLKPQIWVWDGAYTGFIQMKSEKEWQQFESSYLDFILAFARLAEQENVSIFCIGTELERFVLQRPEFWKKLIQNIRRVYTGKITYAANWDEFKRVPFWKDLDYIGVDAYFPLSDKASPGVNDFMKGWEPHKKTIEKVALSTGKSVLFTEYGYRSISYTGKEPWNSSQKEGQVDLEAQKNGLQALYNVFWNESWFGGGFVWKWFPNDKAVGGSSNNRFTPQNKPAENIIREVYEK